MIAITASVPARLAVCCFLLGIVPALLAQDTAGSVRITDDDGFPEFLRRQAESGPAAETVAPAPVAAFRALPAAQPAAVPPPPEVNVEQPIVVEVEGEEEAGEASLSNWWHSQSSRFVSRNRRRSGVLGDWMFDELSLYTPAGNGTAPPFGTYRMVYPVNPRYIDPRDTMLYGAQGAGIPIAIPVAPTVGSVINYGTGIPASRITRISGLGR